MLHLALMFSWCFQVQAHWTVCVPVGMTRLSVWRLSFRQGLGSPQSMQGFEELLHSSIQGRTDKLTLQKTNCLFSREQTCTWFLSSRYQPYLHHRKVLEYKISLVSYLEVHATAQRELKWLWDQEGIMLSKTPLRTSDTLCIVVSWFSGDFYSLRTQGCWVASSRGKQTCRKQ